MDYPMSDAHWLGAAPALPPGFGRVRARVESRYLTLRDGVRIAIDVHVPDGARGPVPAIVRQTRYLRALEPRFRVASRALEAFDLYARTRRAFLAAGYAWIDVDVRGSGASTGTRPCPWSPDEVADGAEIVDWIVAQPWSSGAVGSLGISYDGTCADMLLVNRHPAVRAVAPTYALYDVFADVGFPGGIHLAWFTEAWAAYNAALDRGAFHDAFREALRLIARTAAVLPEPRGTLRALAFVGRMDDDRFRSLTGRLLAALVSGVRPVPSDEALLADAVADHAANFDIHRGALRVTYRDDAGMSSVLPEGTTDTFSPHRYAGDASTSGAAVYSYSGWRDGAYPNGAIKRFHALRTRGSRLTIGPWVHGGKLAIRPFGLAVPPRFDHDAELLAFFDEHVAGREPRGDGRAVHWYTFVADRWSAADAWPPRARTWTLHLDESRTLVAGAPADPGSADALRIDPACGTGERSRWRSLLSLVPGDYPDRARRDRDLLCYDGASLERDVEVTGHAVIAVFAAWHGTGDGQLFAYLEDVAPDGRVAYVTEGQLRALHRGHGPREPGSIPERTFRRADGAALADGEVAEIVFDLLPVSWLFRRGHRIRLALAGADADHFTRPAPATLRVHRSRAHPSRIELPVVDGAG